MQPTPTQSTITGRNQTLIPATIRKQFNIHHGDTLMWINGAQSPRVVPVPADPLKALYGRDMGENPYTKLLHERISMQIVDVEVDDDVDESDAQLNCALGFALIPSPSIIFHILPQSNRLPPQQTLHLARHLRGHAVAGGPIQPRHDQCKRQRRAGPNLPP